MGKRGEILAHRRLQEFWNKHPNAKSSLKIWYSRTREARWQNFTQLRQVFPQADQVGSLTVFNISGNNYRLITPIDYKYQKVFIRAVLTHSEYDTDNWKNDPWFS